MGKRGVRGSKSLADKGWANTSTSSSPVCLAFPRCGPAKHCDTTATPPRRPDLLDLVYKQQRDRFPPRASRAATTGGQFCRAASKADSWKLRAFEQTQPGNAGQSIRKMVDERGEWKPAPRTAHKMSRARFPLFIGVSKSRRGCPLTP